MRTKKELFILLKDNKKLFKTGLCDLCKSLFYRCIIDIREYATLLYYIKINRPKWYSRHYSIVIFFVRGFYWKPKKWKPRLKWINSQIKKLS